MAIRFPLALLTMIVASIATFPSCSKSAKDRVAGTWSVDMKSILEDKDMPEGQRKMMEAMFADASMQVTFQADGNYAAETKMMGQEKEENGTWSVVSSQGENVTVQSVNEEDGKTETVTMSFQGEDTFTVEKDGQKMTFRRAKKESK